DSLMARAGHRSVPLAALGRTVPEQTPDGFVLGRLEQVRADRLCQGGIVDLQGDIIAGLFAGAFPSGADLRSVIVAVVNTIVRRILSVGVLGGDEHDPGVERERADVAGIAVLGAREFADLRHGSLLCYAVKLGKKRATHRVAARHSKRPS